MAKGDFTGVLRCGRCGKTFRCYVTLFLHRKVWRCKKKRDTLSGDPAAGAGGGGGGHRTFAKSSRSKTHG